MYAKRAADAAFAAVEVDAGADVAALAKAIIAELQLGVPPNTVKLTVEGAGAALESRKPLKSAGVLHGTSIIVDVEAPVSAETGERRGAASCSCIAACRITRRHPRAHSTVAHSEQ
jgi:hypothetical protein